MLLVDECEQTIDHVLSNLLQKSVLFVDGKIFFYYINILKMSHKTFICASI